MRIFRAALFPSLSLCLVVVYALACGGGPEAPDGGLHGDGFTGGMDASGMPDGGTSCGSVTTADHCGACDNACPGLGRDTGDAVCADPGSKRCDLTCRGENYDVDRDPGNGCEQLHTGPGHTRSTATDRGSKSCSDLTSKDAVTASLFSDSRLHTNPSVEDFSGTLGTAPDYFKVQATGGIGCVNDYSVTFETHGGGATECYRCTLITDKTTDSVTISGAGSKAISGGAGSYSGDTPIYFKVEKTCPLPVQEAVAYKISYHL